MKIYGFFNSLKTYGDAEAIAIDEDGVIVATHISSGEHWGKNDLGMSNGCKSKHDVYDAAYPDGWECEFVHNADRDNHAGLQAALAKYKG